MYFVKFNFQKSAVRKSLMTSSEWSDNVIMSRPKVYIFWFRDCPLHPALDRGRGTWR